MTVEVSPTVTTPGTTTQEQQTIARMFTFDAFQQVKISAIVADVVTESGSNSPVPGAAQPTPSPANIKIKAYLLALNAQDALVLKNMQDSGAIFDIVLRSPTSNELFDISPITEEYLLQRYKLQIPR
jgi:hypothetical protein